MGDQDVLSVAMKMPQSFAAGDWNTFSTILAEDTTLDSPVTHTRGPEQILQYFRGLKSAFPDMAGQVVSAIAMGNTAAIELRSEGTHTEPMHTSRGTLPPTGKRVVIKLAFFYEISNGKIVAIREYFDPAGFMAQLGVGAAPAAAADA